MAKTRAEADEYCARLGQAEREALGVRQELEKEVDQVRRELLSRLTELEPLPDALRRSELLLQETHDREHAQERQSVELGSALADLRRKVRNGTHRQHATVPRRRKRKEGVFRRA